MHSREAEFGAEADAFPDLLLGADVVGEALADLC